VGVGGRVGDVGGVGEPVIGGGSVGGVGVGVGVGCDGDVDELGVDGGVLGFDGGVLGVDRVEGASCPEKTCWVDGSGIAGWPAR